MYEQVLQELYGVSGHKGFLLQDIHLSEYDFGGDRFETIELDLQTVLWSAVVYHSRIDGSNYAFGIPSLSSCLLRDGRHLSSDKCILLCTVLTPRNDGTQQRLEGNSEKLYGLLEWCNACL